VDGHCCSSNRNSSGWFAGQLLSSPPSKPKGAAKVIFAAPLFKY